jgi:hypothetical protein
MIQGVITRPSITKSIISRNNHCDYGIYKKMIIRKRASNLDVAAGMTSTCTEACKFIDYGVRFFLKSMVALMATAEGSVSNQDSSLDMTGVHPEMITASIYFLMISILPLGVSHASTAAAMSSTGTSPKRWPLCCG